MPPTRVVVWGNCQAAPVADLLRGPLAPLGWDVVDVPPVFLLTPDDVAGVYELLPDTALLVSQPIRDEYRVPGCSTDRLAALLPPSGRLITFPVIYHSGSLPYQVTANGADGARVPAPRTDYHDLRLLAAAARGESADDVLADWPRRAPDDAVLRHAADSLAELRARESTCDVAASDLVGEPGALYTLNHPCNAVLAEVVRRVLTVLDAPTGPVDVPAREYLGAIRTPVEGPGTQASTASDPWTIAGAPVPWEVVIAEHLDWYRGRPDVVADGLVRNARRAAQLGLDARPAG